MVEENEDEKKEKNNIETSSNNQAL